MNLAPSCTYIQCSLLREVRHHAYKTYTVLTIS